MSIDWNRVFETGVKVVNTVAKSAVNSTISSYDRISRDKKYTDEQRERARIKRDELKMQRDSYFNDWKLWGEVYGV